jgi:AraC-like DNA-binding protein
MDFNLFSEGTRQDSTPGSAALPRFHSSTLDVPRDQRLRAWRLTIEALFEARAAEGEAFSACLTVYHFNRFLLCRARLDGARYYRDSVRLGWCDLDHYLLHLPLQRGLVAGTGLRVRPSDMVILDLAQPADFRTTTSEGVSLLIPRTALAPLLHDAGQLHGLVLRRDTAAGALLAPLLVSLAAAAPRLAMDEALRLTRPILALVAACLGPVAALQAELAAHATRASAREPRATGRKALVPSTLHVSLGRKVRLYIEQNLHREDLAPVVLAKELGVSRSQLYRAFERLGGVCHYLRQRRLRRCLLALCDVANSGRRIVDLACEHGFADEAHFSRLFRKAFGLSPKAARNALQRGDPSVFSGLLSPSGKPCAFTHWVRELTSC